MSRNENAISLATCPNFTISHNTLFRNSNALYLGSSDRCNITENEIYLNSRGILLNSSSRCLITQNNVSYNTGVGISLDNTANLNDIYENTFANNSPNAICGGSSNNWDNYPIVDLPPTTPIRGGPWEIDPLIILTVGGAAGLVALVIIIREKRRVIIID